LGIVPAGDAGGLPGGGCGISSTYAKRIAGSAIAAGGEEWWHVWPSTARPTYGHVWPTYGLVERGSEALEVAPAQHNTAMLIDLHMPDMDGVSLIEQLKVRRVSSTFFLLSGQLDIAATVRAVRAGATDVLEKPISAAALDNAYARLSNLTTK
jgi:CheY-like chemotaxis protein